MTSFIESLFQEKYNHEVVPCQTDEIYKNISSNQCSWCAAEFAQNSLELRKLFLSDREKFSQLYQECLMNGSQKRHLYGDKVYGENIDNPVLLSHYQLAPFKYETILLNNTPKFAENLPEDLLSEFYQRKYLPKKVEDCQDIIGNIFVMISRHGQSLTIIPVINDLYLILDSHVHRIGLMNYESMVKYLVYDRNQGHNHITLIYGQMPSL